MKRNILIACIVIVLVALIFLFGHNKSVAPTTQQQPAVQQQPASQRPTQQQQPAATDQMQQSTNPAADQSDQASKPATNPTNDTKPMGLDIKTTQEGTGVAVKAGDTVSVLYTGKLTDGTIFDTTASRGNQPFSFTVGAGQVIKGWDQGLIGMKVGEKRTLTIPSDLGYGAQGAGGGAIPPNATLIFDIELLSIK